MTKRDALTLNFMEGSIEESKLVKGLVVLNQITQVF